MARHRNAPPAATSGALGRENDHSPALTTLAAHRAQWLASRFALPIDLAGTIATLALGIAHAS